MRSSAVADYTWDQREAVATLRKVSCAQLRRSAASSAGLRQIFTANVVSYGRLMGLTKRASRDQGLNSAMTLSATRLANSPDGSVIDLSIRSSSWP
jgi:hypothetical protein